MKNKYGFTLSEVMITMAVLGVLAALMIPAVMKVRPNQKAVMFKKSYATFEKAIGNIIGDDLHYPSDKVSLVVGGDCTYTSAGTPCGFAWESLTSDIPDGNNKFCYLLSQELNYIGASICDATMAAGTPFLTTSDGIAWYMTNAAFTLGPTVYKFIGVDVNGVKPPNCSQTNNLGATFTSDAAKATCTDPDRFEMGVRYDGRIMVDGTAGQKYLTDQTVNNY